MDSQTTRPQYGEYPRVLFVASEAFPLAKTGGLGDVCGALPIALSRLGVDVRLLLPGYARALDATNDTQATLSVDPGGRIVCCRMPGSGIPVYFFDRPDLFYRSGGLYQDAGGSDWFDNHVRYSAFCHAAVQLALRGDRTGWRPDVVHAHDWHTGLVPALLAMHGHPRPATVFTIHNLAFQGNFPLAMVSELALPPELLTCDGAEFYGQFSFLKAGIRYADRLTTVSPTYAKDILTPEYGAGLHGLLQTRARDLVGILNGVDYDVWDPANDAAIAERYGADSIAGKSVCKTMIRLELGLDGPSDVPLIVFVNRLTQQKMADVVLRSLPSIVASGAQFVLHGQGDRQLEADFVAAASGQCSQVAVRIGYEEALAHRLTAAADISLTASRFEPCGLTTLYAMRYGALPVTRLTGGVTDTVVDATDTGDASGTGFAFTDPTADAMTACVNRACTRFYDPVGWHQLQCNAMRRDSSWRCSALNYAAIYRDLVQNVGGTLPATAG